MRAPDSATAGPELPELRWLFGLQRFGAQPGLERVRALLAAVGDPHQRMRSVLVAGTNGKGSVARTLAAVLEASGERTGLFVSPHLQHVGERAQVDGRIPDDAEMDRWVGAVRPHAERLRATFFEVVTVAALLRFAAAEVRWAVLEVGMGGRLDATNAVEPELSLITSVALDHMAVLGGDVATIAREKAGILRHGVPAASSADGDAARAIAEVAHRVGAPIAFLGQGFDVEVVTMGWEGLALRFRDAAYQPDPLSLRTPLVGRHQAANVALAAAGALRLGVPPERIASASADTRWPGRLERLRYQGRWFVLDGAHNPHAASALAAAVGELEGRVDALVLGVSQDKDVAGVVQALAPVARRWIVTRALASPRAAAPDALAGVVARQVAGAAPDGVGARHDPGAVASGHEYDHTGVVAVEADPAAAIRAALDVTPPDGTVVVAGSLFLVGEVRALLSGEATEGYERWQ